MKDAEAKYKELKSRLDAAQSKFNEKRRALIEEYRGVVTNYKINKLRSQLG